LCVCVYIVNVIATTILTVTGNDVLGWGKYQAEMKTKMLAGEDSKTPLRGGGRGAVLTSTRYQNHKIHW